MDIAPGLPTELGLRTRVKDEQQQGAELAPGGGPFDVREIEQGRLAVYMGELVVFQMVEVAQFDGEDVFAAPAIIAFRVFVALDHLRADEVRQACGVVESRLTRLCDQ